jgi:hypothetical protein
MTNQIAKRIQIIDGFKSIYSWKGKTLKYISLLDFGIVMILLVFSILASVLSWNWENSGLLVLMAMSLSIRAPFGFIELILKNHSKEIEDLNIDFEDKLNQNLEFLISKFNDRKKYLYITGLPAILILIAALLQVFDLNPYWDKFPYFVGGVSVYILVRINYDIIRLKKNLRKVNLCER